MWRPGQIAAFRQMQGYPFGTFLFWRVNPENSGNFKSSISSAITTKEITQCPPLPDMPNRQVTAVLDGQQRLTALNVGLYGSISRKLPHRWSSPDAFPKRRLYLDLLSKATDEDEDGMKYQFEFLTGPCEIQSRWRVLVPGGRGACQCKIRACHGDDG